MKDISFIHYRKININNMVNVLKIKQKKLQKLYLAMRTGILSSVYLLFLFDKMQKLGIPVAQVFQKY